MKWEKVEPAALDGVLAALRAESVLPGVVVLFAILGAWLFASWATR